MHCGFKTDCHLNVLWCKANEKIKEMYQKKERQIKNKIKLRKASDGMGNIKNFPQSKLLKTQI